MKKKVVIAVISFVLIAMFVGVAFYFWKDKKDKDAEGLCYVESVSVITGNGMTWNNRFMGIVETQEVTKVTKDREKVVKEIFVEEEDEVKAGDKLFEYDTDEMILKVRQLELELSSYYNSISTMYEQIETLAAERDLVPADQKIEYTSQIQNLQAQINQTSYDASAKQLEIDRQYAAINNSVVYAPVDGIISSINNQESQEDAYDYYGNPNGDSDAFISIMAMGDFRIKCSVTELNAYSLYEGMPVFVRSRVDETKVWTGVISKVDLEHPESNDNMYYYSPGETATKYPFYVQVDSSEGMMLGQHLYVELDYGQGTAKEGMWLYESYIVFDGMNSYVWAENKEGKLEKREVSLGEYDEEMMMYEITSGLSDLDYIAFPEMNLKEGMKTTHNFEDIVIDENFDSDDVTIEDGMFNEQIYYEDGVIEEDIFYEDGTIEEDIYYEDGIIEENFDDESFDKEEIPVGDANHQSMVVYADLYKEA